MPGRQAVVVRYRSDNALTLRIRPFLAYRDYHSLRHADSSPYAGLPPLEFRSEGHLCRRSEVVLQHRISDRTRAWSRFPRGSVHARRADASICNPENGLPSAPRSTAQTRPIRPSAKRDPFIVRRFDGKPTIIAGYPWFTDWGRDTMISLPGLLIAPGRLDEAREIIEGFLQFRNQGIIPNRFPDAGETPEYNTADATLWMFQAVRAWLAGRRRPRFSSRCVLSGREGDHRLAPARHLVQHRRRSRRSSAGCGLAEHAAHVDGRQSRRLGGHAARWKAGGNQRPLARGAVAHGRVGADARRSGRRRIPRRSDSSPRQFSSELSGIPSANACTTC